MVITCELRAFLYVNTGQTYLQILNHTFLRVANYKYATLRISDVMGINSCDNYQRKWIII
jgi:hypothetical protein